MSLINLTTQINKELSDSTELPIFLGFLPQQGRLPLLVIEHSDTDRQKCSGKVVLKNLTTNVILFVENPMDIFKYNDMIENYFNDINMVKVYTSPVEYDGIYYKEFRFQATVKINNDDTCELYHQ